MTGLLTLVREKLTEQRVVQVAVSDIFPNQYQPRRHFAEEDLRALADSIRQNGILQPLTVRRIGEQNELIAGERRLRAAKLAGMSHVPCIIMEINDRNAAILALVENIQREDLNCFEEAAALEKLITCYGMTQEDAALQLGKAQSTIANLKKAGFKIHAAALGYDSDYRDADYTGDTALLIGNEGNGVSDAVKAVATHHLCLPMRGGAESLNAAVAAGIMMYDLTR